MDALRKLRRRLVYNLQVIQPLGYGTDMRTYEEQIAHRAIDEARVEALADDMRQQVRAYRLREIRNAQAISQSDLAQQLQVSQNRISQLEHGQIGRSQIDTLRRYVEALGGQLHIQAAFGDTQYTIA